MLESIGAERREQRMQLKTGASTQIALCRAERRRRSRGGEEKRRREGGEEKRGGRGKEGQGEEGEVEERKGK